MADYSPGPPLSPEIRERLDREEKERDQARLERQEKYLEQAKKILDRGSVVSVSELVDLVVAENQPIKSEIWASLRDLIFNQHPDYAEVTYGRIGRRNGQIY